MADGAWYYAKDDAQQGPVSKSQLQELLVSESLSKDHLVWRQGMAEWTAAGVVSELEESPPMPVEKAAPSDEKKEKRAKNRLRLLGEIIETERAYNSTLAALERVYIVPLRLVADQPKGAIFSHADLDKIFLNLDTIAHLNSKFLEDLEAEVANCKELADVQFATIFLRYAHKFHGCYGRYATNLPTAEAHLKALRVGHTEQDRYLKVCENHPDAVIKGQGKRPVQFFLTQPVQRILRYKMLLEDTLKSTDDEHADAEPLRAALSKVSEVAIKINREKGEFDQLQELKNLLPLFASGSGLDSTLVRLNRRIIKEGVMTKMRLWRRQERHVWLFNDLLLYAEAKSHKEHKFVLKGSIALDDGARVEQLPSTENLQHAFLLVEKGGKGYTWLADTADDGLEWFAKVDGAIRSCQQGAAEGAPGAPILPLAVPHRWPLVIEAHRQLAAVKSSPIDLRMAVATSGASLIKYNQRDGSSEQRWVLVTRNQLSQSVAAWSLAWGDAKKRTTTSELKLGEAKQLTHGAKSATFFKMRAAKKDPDWLCFSIVSKERTLDFAAPDIPSVLDWYLAIGSLMPHSTEPLLTEEELLARIETMVGR